MPSPDREPLADPSPGGRTFTGRRKVRLGDVDPTGRLRLDALTRYTQDVSDDDTTAAGLEADPGWVVRRTTVDVIASARLAEWLTFTTFCSGLGGRWAERRLRICGEDGARYEVATLWICVDVTSGRPHRLTDQFHQIYGPAAAGRTVSARLSQPAPPDGLERTVWPLRAVDFDTIGHVNNAAYWAVVEEHLSAEHRTDGLRATIEYRSGLAPEDEVSIATATATASATATAGHSTMLWWMLADGSVAASAQLS